MLRCVLRCVLRRVLRAHLVKRLIEIGLFYRQLTSVTFQVQLEDMMLFLHADVHGYHIHPLGAISSFH